MSSKFEIEAPSFHCPICQHPIAFALRSMHIPSVKRSLHIHASRTSNTLFARLKLRLWSLKACVEKNLLGPKIWRGTEFKIEKSSKIACWVITNHGSITLDVNWSSTLGQLACDVLYRHPTTSRDENWSANPQRAQCGTINNSSIVDLLNTYLQD